MSNEACNLYVKYSIRNRSFPNFAGPYNKDDIKYHYNDILTFDGVFNMSIVSESEKIEFEK